MGPRLGGLGRGAWAWAEGPGPGPGGLGLGRGAWARGVRMYVCTYGWTNKISPAFYRTSPLWGHCPKRIDEAMVKKTQDDLWKTCPNCSAQFPRSGRKCPECGIFFQKFLRENAVLLEDSKVDDSNSWSPTLHYQHVTNQHPEGFHKIVVLDPLLANPISRYNILALCYHLMECAN